MHVAMFFEAERPRIFVTAAVAILEKDYGIISVFSFGPGTFLLQPGPRCLCPKLQMPKTSGSAYFGKWRGE
jgi:hypothetical protein